MDLYRHLLANAEWIEAGDEHEVMHNYATVLYKHDYDDEAGCLWFESYGLPGGQVVSGIRQALSMYLMRANRADLAGRVIRGESIDVEERVLQPAQRAIPDRFSTVDLGGIIGTSNPPETFRCVDSPPSL